MRPPDRGRDRDTGWRIEATGRAEDTLPAPRSRSRGSGARSFAERVVQVPDSDASALDDVEAGVAEQRDHLLQRDASMAAMEVREQSFLSPGAPAEVDREHAS